MGISTNKKSQIKMMETIAVLIVFLVLMVFLLIIYVKMGAASSGTTNDEQAELRAIEVSQIVSSLPEFQCSSRNVILENCFDKEKLEQFSSTTNAFLNDAKNNTYFELFKESNVSVHEIYPNQNYTKNIYNRRPQKAVVGTKQTHIPISLYDPYTKKSSFGILIVSVYVKN